MSTEATGEPPAGPGADEAAAASRAGQDFLLPAAGLLLSAWLILLLTGLAAGGAVHLLLLASLALGFKGFRAR